MEDPSMVQTLSLVLVQGLRTSSGFDPPVGFEVVQREACNSSQSYCGDDHGTMSLQLQDGGSLETRLPWERSDE